MLGSRVISEPLRSGGTRIQSVARSCQLLLWLAERPDGATAKEAAFATKLALSTAYHLLNTLVEEGLLVKDSERRYILGEATARLAHAYRQRSEPGIEARAVAGEPETT